jgi:hypothetical protein
MTIVQNEGPICWKFVVPNEAATGHEEVVLSVQGIISQKDLPPVMIRYAVNTRHLGLAPLLTKSTAQMIGRGHLSVKVCN